MSGIHKSNSYPERLKDAHTRQEREGKTHLENKIKLTIETLDKFREKDHERAEHFASIGSPSSLDVVVHTDWRARCCNIVGNVINFLLEREEETRRRDELIQKKSYAGFYYFIKWFTRALFFLVFTTLGTISGKEIGCEIKDHNTCKTGVVKLANSSPHMVASIIGLIVGLLVGQWIGRIIWDKMTMCIRQCLRRIEKRADRTKVWLFITATFVYILVTGAFATVFFFFVDLGQDDENIIGGIVGGCIGLVLAMLAYRKSSSCRSGQVSETPMIRAGSEVTIPPDLQI